MEISISNKYAIGTKIRISVVLISLLLPLFSACSDVRTYESIEDKRFKNALNEVVKKADLKTACSCWVFFAS